MTVSSSFTILGEVADNGRDGICENNFREAVMGYVRSVNKGCSFNDCEDVIDISHVWATS